MFARALIVLLAVANLGVALWWALQPAPTRVDVPVADPGVPLLQLVDATRPPPRPQAPAPEVVAAPRCFAFGPFADAAATQRARAVLQPRAARVRLRADAAAKASAWRVWLPPQADRAAADALAARIAAAGFDDWFVLRTGAERNAIALGRFGNAASARSRAAALQAKGFAAEAEPILAAGVARWLDVRGEPGFDPQALREAAGAERAEPHDCDD
ncbi:MAG TPA: hypothetical protein VFG18_05595 [Xanthomonadaceae bacterium]|nr:hypothetical protein [Xanthomonadaceae bacterium]